MVESTKDQNFFNFMHFGTFAVFELFLGIREFLLPPLEQAVIHMKWYNDSQNQLANEQMKK